MATKRLTLNFPPHLIDQPVTYQLITEHNLKVNILRARITPREWGRLVVEISGKKKNLDAGLQFATELGLDIKPLAQDVSWHEDKCIECTACSSVCPTGALSVERKRCGSRLSRKNASPVSCVFQPVPMKPCRSPFNLEIYDLSNTQGGSTILGVCCYDR
jgi:ferredoxin